MLGLRVIRPVTLTSFVFRRNSPIRLSPTYRSSHTDRNRIVIRPEPAGPSNNGYQYFQNRPRDNFRNNPRIWWIVGGVGGLGGLYYVTHLEKVPISNRTRFMAVSPQMEERISRQAYAQIMSQYGQSILPPHHPASHFVRKVAEKIVQVSGMGGLKWEVHVIDNPEKNAFVLPGGKIFVFTGILPIVQTEDGLAAVLGHEIAHQVARHSAEKLSTTQLVLLSQILLSFFIDPGFIFNRLLLQFGVLMPFSRRCEVEADYIGMKLMAQACYDPEAAVGVWKRMKEAERQAPPEYLSTHPSNENRIKKVTEWLPEARRVRENSDCHQTTDMFNAFGDQFHRKWAYY